MRVSCSPLLLSGANAFRPPPMSRRARRLTKIAPRPWLMGLWLMGLCLLAMDGPAAAQTAFFVSPDGNDSWTGRSAGVGSSDGPFATLERAKAAVRAVKAAGGLPPGGITVTIAAGTYRLPRTLALSAADSGTGGAPVVWQAASPGTVRLSGGVAVAGFGPIADPAIAARLAPAAREKVREADLAAHGVTDFGRLQRRGFGYDRTPAALEVFADGRPLPLARWPNQGFLRIAQVPEGRSGGAFTFTERPRAPWAQADEVWAFGYWFHTWAPEHLPLASVALEAGIASFGKSGPRFGLSADAAFYFLNVFEELDRPGEWYLDRQRGRLYVWLPDGTTAVEVSLLPTVLRLDGTSHLRFSGMVFDGARGPAVIIHGGDHNRLEDCEVRGAGSDGLLISGEDNGIVNCRILDAGDRALVMEGGRRQTLTPGRLFAVDNRIERASRWSRSSPAVRIEGVGQRLANTLIADAPHIAVWFVGNDHVIERNEIHGVAAEAGDTGAIYTGADWTAQGTVIRHNYIHHLASPAGRAAGIYLDDQASGIEVSGNIFYRVPLALLIGGGRDNLITGNLFVDCETSVHLDARGRGWQKVVVDDPKGPFRTGLAEVAYDRPPFSNRYPMLKFILKDEPGTPKRNAIVNNIHAGKAWLEIDEETRSLQIITGNFLHPDPLFVRAPHQRSHPRPGDFALSAASPAVKGGFPALPLAQIGPQARPAAP